MRKLLVTYLSICLSVLTSSLTSYAQPATRTAGQQARNTACLLKVAAARLHIREATGRNDGPAIDAMLRLVGSPLRSPWCGAEQAQQQRLCGLPFPRHAGAAKSWAAERPRTYFLQGVRGTVDSLKPGHQVMFYYPALGRIAHVGRAIAPGRSIRKGRPARGWYTIEGNTNPQGSREGGGVHRLFRLRSEFYAAANWTY